MDRMAVIDVLLTNTHGHVRAYPYNSTSAYEVYLLAAVESSDCADNIDAKMLSRVIDFISKDGFDVSDYFLFNSNQEGCFTFCRTDGTGGGSFDITYYSRSNIEISYMDDNYDDHVCERIAVAVANYTECF